MKQELLSNLHQLVHIKITDKQLKSKYTYLPPEKAKWYRKAKPARLFDGYFTVNLPDDEWLKDNHYILDEENKIWSKPRLYLWFSDGDKPLQYIYQTYEEAVTGRDRIVEKSKNIGLIDLEKIMTDGR